MATINLNWKWIKWEYGYTWTYDVLPQILEEGFDELALNRSLYVIRLNGPFAIQYPWGASSLLYIGQGDFKSRITSHTKSWLNDIWEIIEPFGLMIGVATPRVHDSSSAYKAVEAALIHEFSSIYGTAPLNNDQSECSELEHPFNPKELRDALSMGKAVKHKWAITPMKSNRFYEHYHKADA